MYSWCVNAVLGSVFFHFICQSLGTLSRVNWTSSLRDGDENTYNAHSVLMPLSTLEKLPYYLCFY